MRQKQNMRKKILALLLIFIAHTFSVEAQSRDTVQPLIKPVVNADFLFQRAKNQKAGAWLLLGAAAGATIAGIVINNNTPRPRDIPGILESARSIDTGEFLELVGGALITTSILLFISSGENKKRAGVMLKNESAFMSRLLHFKENFISVGISLKL